MQIFFEFAIVSTKNTGVFSKKTRSDNQVENVKVFDEDSERVNVPSEKHQSKKFTKKKQFSSVFNIYGI